ncbi:MAG TPA: hypothetical protein VM658_17300 [bacterium]|nr:hypothetical protein [bacterium]
MNERRAWKWAALAVVLAAAAGCAHEVVLKPTPEFGNPVADVRSDADEPLLAGFAKEAITPHRPALMAGFGLFRVSVGAHDDLFVRTLVVKQGSEKLALVAVDCIGLQRTDVMAIKAAVAGFRPDQVLIASTHTHSGPDTIGLWGLPPYVSGQDQRFMQSIKQAVVNTIARADAAAEPAAVLSAVYPMDPAIMINANAGEPKDDTMGIMVFRDGQGRAVATLVNVAGHAESMWSNNRVLTADYPGVICREVEKNYGGGAIFFNGALGAMITPNLPQSSKGRSWETMEDIGERVFREVERGMDLLVKDEKPAIAHRQSLVLFPMKNEQYLYLSKTGLLNRDSYVGENIITEVNVIEIGSAQFVTFPGEAYPKLGMKVRARQKPLSFQIGLAADELGYIIAPPDYGSDLYEYETSMCAGPDLAGDIEQELGRLLAE